MAEFTRHNQTRIWLGEVLDVSFDEDVAILDLLADGELLFQVSKKVWKMLLRKYGEVKHSKMHIYERTSSGKSDGRYMPYPKVDSFLKICQILGLNGIDLFSPSDVVEKRDIRRVCMCIRSLSKKARSKKLNVPDFDFVTYNIAMPTRLVGSICRNLELLRYAKEISGPHSQYSDSRSDESESNFSELEFESPFSSASSDVTNIACIVGEVSPELSPISDDFVHLSKAEPITLQNMSSSYSEHPTDQDTSTFFSEVCKGIAGSIPHVKNGLKADSLAGTSGVKTSYKALEDYQHSQSSFSSTLSHHEVHGSVEVEPCHSRQENFAVKKFIISNNKAMTNSFYYMETSDNSDLVIPINYSLDAEAVGNDEILPSQIKSPSILDLNSLDNHACNTELEGSESIIVSRKACSFFSSCSGMQNNFSPSLVGHPSERDQYEPVHTCLSSVANDSALLCQSDDPNHLAIRKCGSQSTNPSISSLIESKFECSSSSSICLTYKDVYIEDGSYLVTGNCMQENDVNKANSIMDLNEDFINNLVPVVHEDVDIAACRLSLEKEKLCNNASYRINIGTEVGSNIDNAASCQSCLTHENAQMAVKGSWSEDPCPHYNFHKFDSLSKNKMIKHAFEPIENHGNSLNYTEAKDYGFICGSVVDLCCSDLFRIRGNSLETEGETFQIVDILPSSSLDSREREVASAESMETEKHAAYSIHDDCAVPSDVPQAILDNAIIWKDIIMTEECGKGIDTEGTVGKTGNHVLKSVARVMTMVGSFVFFLHVSQKKHREKKNEMWMPFQVQKPNQEFFSKRKIIIGKSNSSYQGEKLKF
ncbi:uncharacterized protein LOC110024745 [Phalaenopsis equestris]|uniref:uncharacterized protein LOC110024745 n=1 Tax=Phalaenopsis equestris TaxID=78828 RepID=UPI0009E45438|nr:uncharacterized protein LOC110024745 [Phalaenopsis equestris]